MENQRLIGFLLILSGMALIVLIFLVIFPNLMGASKYNLFLLFGYTSFSQPYPDPFKEAITTLLFTTTFQSFQQIENSSFLIYIGVTLGVFGAVLMFFEGVSLEEIEESEDDSKKISKEK